MEDERSDLNCPALGPAGALIKIGGPLLAEELHVVQKTHSKNRLRVWSRAPVEVVDRVARKISKDVSDEKKQSKLPENSTKLKPRREFRLFRVPNGELLPFGCGDNWEHVH